MSDPVAAVRVYIAVVVADLVTLLHLVAAVVVAAAADEAVCFQAVVAERAHDHSDTDRYWDHLSDNARRRDGHADAEHRVAVANVLNHIHP